MGYTVKSGDGWNRISQQTGISVEDLQKYNPKITQLHPGQVLNTEEVSQPSRWQKARNLVQSLNGNPVVKTLQSAARKQINEHVIEPIFGEDSWLRLKGGVDRKKDIGNAYDREIIDQANFLIEQNPEIQKAGGIEAYFKQNPDASISLNFTDNSRFGNTIDLYNKSRGKARYGSNNESIIDKFVNSPSQYLIGQWNGTLTKDGLSITDTFNFDLSDKERENYTKKAESGNWYARARLWADKYAESSEDDTALIHKLNYPLRKFK